MLQAIAPKKGMVISHISISPKNKQYNKVEKKYKGIKLNHIEDESVIICFYKHKN
jgi:hypothetical protein